MLTTRCFLEESLFPFAAVVVYAVLPCTTTMRGEEAVADMVIFNAPCLSWSSNSGVENSLVARCPPPEASLTKNKSRRMDKKEAVPL